MFHDRAAAVWPWMVTPLTARVMEAIFALGIAGLGALADRRWSSARISLQVAALMLALILAAGLRANGELTRLMS
jgi:predicted membrane metal-binding protein